jgi:membrane fusion protein (multidrug efflux system)
MNYKQMKNKIKLTSGQIRWIAISLIILLVVGMVIYPQAKKYYSDDNEDVKVIKVPATKEKKPLDVYYEVIAPSPLSEKIQAVGSLLPDEEVDLSFESSGKITSINFQEGTMVRKGQLLAKINDQPLQAQLLKLSSQITLAENRVYRQQTLLEKDAVSQEALEQVKSELDQLKADIELVKSQITQTELRAPFDGYIGLRLVSEGNYVSQQTPISRLTKIKPMKIDFSISEKYAFKVHDGTKVHFKMDEDIHASEATVYALDAMINPDTRTRKVRAIFPNSSGNKMPGAFVTVEILLQEIPNAISIPSQALIPEMGVDKVYLYKSGKAQPAEVITGLRTESRVQIIKGLQPGDTLITSGMLQLRTDMPVVLNK